MTSRIKYALRLHGIQVGEVIPWRIVAEIRNRLATQTPETWQKFHRSWYRVTDDKPGDRPKLIIRLA